MITILTKYHGPTNTRGARISAKFGDCGGRASVPYDHSKDGVDRHRDAAYALLLKSNFRAEQLTEHVGGLTGGYVFLYHDARI